MADSAIETRLKALYSALAAALPTGALLDRNASLPSRIPAEGAVILRDGEPGEPEVTLSPLTYHYEYRAGVDILVERAPASRDAIFDALRQAVGQVLAANRTLGGLCDWVEGEAPAPFEIPIEGAENLKAATIPVVLFFATADPLL